MDFSILLTGSGLLYLFILILFEVVLGIDNIIFISVITDGVEKKEQRKARNIGLALALIIRLVLLAFVGWLMSMKDPLFVIWGWDATIQHLILLLGGLFLIYKSTHEMHKNVTGEEDELTRKKGLSLRSVVIQIVLVDIVFSFDSIITAIGMTSGIAEETGSNPLIIIYLAVIISMIVMMVFVKSISDFINQRPTIKMLALAFLVTLGVILVAESFGQEIPKGYIYFAMVFALFMEMINIKMRKNQEVKKK
jgi:predicted tellurium resistance membrane protein TerC